METRVNHDGSLTEVFRHALRYAGVCVTGALEPCGLMHGALGVITVPAGIEIILI